MGLQPHPPERPADQGLTPDQGASAERAILALLTDPAVEGQVDLVITWRRAADGLPENGAYEVWSRRGLVRFQRAIDEEGRLVFPVLEVVGENPIADDGVDRQHDVAQEAAASRAAGFASDDPARRFIPAAAQGYPFAYERIAALFDSPHAPDLVISPEDWSFGHQPGQHGALHLRQSRAPLWMKGPGVRPGVHPVAVRAVDLAPTLLEALGFPRIDGRDATGRRASERGVAPDVYLERQDGRVVDEILEADGPRASAMYVFLLDGLHPTELADRIDSGDDLPNLRRLSERAAVMPWGSIVNFPSITWPSHTTIGTGSWCGHHDVVNPTYYLREKRETVSPQGQQIQTEVFASTEVESLYEAFRRVRGDECLTAAIHAPFGRGADHAVLEGRNLGDKVALKRITEEMVRDEDPRWERDGAVEVAKESRLDSRGVAQVIDLFDRADVRSPDFVYHELILTDGVGHDYGPHSDGLRSAVAEVDRRIGHVLEALDRNGRFEETLFVVTADHGMAPQDTALNANPAHHVKATGLESVVAEPMIWLLDVAVETDRAPDGRTGRIRVFENDRLPTGERPPVEGARVEIVKEGGAGAFEALSRGTTGPGGAYGFATPAHVASDALFAVIEAPGFNPRRVRLDGRPEPCTLRERLYGAG